MKFYKKVLKNQISRQFLAKIIYFYLRFVVYKTSVVKIEFSDEVEAWLADNNGKSFILGFWHQDIMSIPTFKKPMAKRGYASHGFASRHSDGQIIHSVLRNFGVQTVEGSQGKKSAISGTRSILRVLRSENNMMSIALDGPRGPALEAKEGTLKLAEQANCPIFMANITPKRYRRITRAWDNFRVLLPFNMVEIAVTPYSGDSSN